MPRKFLLTSEVAKAAGVHPNTVRLFEAAGYLPPVPRTASGYRMFTEFHRDQMILAHLLLQWPYPGGKSLVEEIVAHSARGDLGGALELAYTYLARVHAEQAHAEAAAKLLERWAQGIAAEPTKEPLAISKTAQLLGVTVDMLRNWERNGLVTIPRDPHNGYRRYGSAEIGRLRVIRTLSRAGYSQMALLRTLLQVDRGASPDLRRTLDTPGPNEDAAAITDQWCTTLAQVDQRVLEALAFLERMIQRPYQRPGIP